MAAVGLDELGIAGGEDLRETLTNCTDPLKAIEQFQLENGILLPTLQSALPFLDLHGIPRIDFHQSVFDELREKLLARTAIIAEGKARDNKLEELLEKSYPLVKMPAIQPVVMHVMKHLPKVPEKYLKHVTSDPALYGVCATEVKRQIWEENQTLLGDEVSPLLRDYIAEKDNLLLDGELSFTHHMLTASPRLRRQGQIVGNLTRMIGRSTLLYDMVLQFLRTLFLRTCNLHYCTMRAELLMSLHDLEINEICSIDPCHKARPRLSAGIPATDLATILCDPFAVSTLAVSTMKILQELASQESLPRDSTDLLLLLRMLSLGLAAWDMIDSQVFKEPKLDVELITRFLPSLMSLLTDDSTYVVDQRLPVEERVFQTYPTSLPDTLTRMMQKQRVACQLGLFYVLHLARQRNKNAIIRVLPVLGESYNDLAYGDLFLHLFTSHLTLLIEDFSSEDFYTPVFDGFLLPAISK
uniref:Negative elongation factor complex member B n=1 Tax=Eptatretus burgeri TaxID=7764 RepID=A0A8C4QQZ5_EPTBU